MDPASAFGLLVNIVTAIEAGIKVIKEVKDVHDSVSGVSRRNTQLDEKITALDKVRDEIRACLVPSTSAVASTSTDDEINKLVSKCAETGLKLRDLLSRVKAGPRKRDAFFKTIKARWKQSELDELEKELKKYQNDLNTLMLSKSLSQLKSIQHATLKPGEDQPDDLINALKDSLWAPEMGYRRDQIHDKQSDTFNWIYDRCMHCEVGSDTIAVDGSDQGDESNRGERNWDCFVCWLQKVGGIYWIKGKAGSGKSTLMNHISRDVGTRTGLHASGRGETTIASFFFWNSGSTFEKSIEGLLRTIIWQIIDQTPQTYNILFPKMLLKQIKQTIGNSDSQRKYWTTTKLIAAMDRLIAATSAGLRFCLFLDGLDEFEGDHALLVGLVQRLSCVSHIKVCISSRPVQRFANTFITAQSLRLEDLTFEDMKKLTSKTLRENSRGDELAKKDETPFNYLVDDITRKAAGVFLWVSLVSRRLAGGIITGDTVETLQKRLENIPNDLNALFHSMIGDLNHNHLDEAARVFRIIIAAPDEYTAHRCHKPTLSLLDLFHAESSTVAASLMCSIGGVDWGLTNNRATKFQQQVESTCCGLVEFVQCPDTDNGSWLDDLNPEALRMLRTTPRLLHQSVKEFLQTQELFTAPYDYERFTAARLMTIKALLHPGLRQSTIHQLANYALALAQHVEHMCLTSNVMLIDEIDVCCMSCARRAGYKSWRDPESSEIKDIVNAVDFVGLNDAGEEVTHPSLNVDTDIDIVAYAAHLGLYAYVKAKIEKTPSLCQRVDKLPILHAMQCVDILKSGDIHSNSAYLHLLRDVLSNGGDANLMYRGKSAWRLRLEAQGSAFTSTTNFIRVPADLTTFIEFGADPNVCFNYEVGLLSSQICDDSSSEKDNTDHLYDILSEVVQADMLQRNEDGDSAFYSTLDIFSFLVEDLFLPQLDNDPAAENGSDSHSDRKDPGNMLVARPVWRVNLLYWAMHTLVDTVEAQDFRQRLMNVGASLRQPFICRISIKDKAIEGFKRSAFRSCTASESRRLTLAWRRHFPSYHLALHVTIMNMCLLTLQECGFLRNDRPLQASQLMQAFEVFGEGIGIKRSRLRIPNLAIASRIIQRLRDLDIITDEALLRFSQMWRFGAAYINETIAQRRELLQNGTTEEDPMQSMTLWMRDMRQRNVDAETIRRFGEKLQNDGYIGDDGELLESSGFLLNGGSLLNHKPFSFDEICRENGLLFDTPKILNQWSWNEEYD